MATRFIRSMSVEKVSIFETHFQKQLERKKLHIDLLEQTHKKSLVNYDNVSYIVTLFEWPES